MREGPAVVAAPGALGIGERLPDVPFTDLAGKSGKLSDLADRKAVVICLTSTTCPVSRKYGPTLAELEAKYRAKGVAFLALNVAQSEAVEKMKDQAADWAKLGWAGRYVADRDQSIGKLLAARSTTEAFVIDRSRTLVYRGAVDDQHGLGYSLDAPRRHFLARAIDAVLTDDRPEVAATTAP
ncbi:MAG TPA: redoxin family protein, partial [Tepidisphaeraceae bacterium]|nr:redoxin family protein [Tepidisphaeraceae bacterium]